MTEEQKASPAAKAERSEGATPAAPESPTVDGAAEVEHTNGASVHMIRPAPPVRAFLIAAVLAMIGAVLSVTASAQQWPVGLIIFGVIITLLGLLLLGTAAWTMFRMRVRAELTPTGWFFRGPNGVRHGTWANTIKVTASDSGRRISFFGRDETVQNVIFPQDGTVPEMEQLTRDITAHLNRARKN